MISKIVSSNEANQTLEKYIRKTLNNAPLSFIYKLFRKKDIKVNNHWQDRKFIIKENDEIKIYVTDSQLQDFQNVKKVKPNDDIKDWIIYEDHNILIVNKPRGLLVQKDSVNGKSLSDMVLSYLVYKNEYQPNVDNAFTPGPAHRIDRNTAGLVIFGKNIEVLQYLFTIFKEKELISKHYYALVKGRVDEKGEINAPIKKDEKNNKVFIAKDGKKAITRYHLIKQFKDYALVEVVILTGRTHQIRVHMASINHPVVGDSKYGDFELNKEFENKYHFKNQFLVAYRLDFGSLDKPLENISSKHFEIQMPEEFSNVIKML